MIHTNSNRDKPTRPNRLSYGEAEERLSRDKSNKQQRRKKRYNWE